MVSLSCSIGSKVAKKFRFEITWLVDNSYKEKLRGLWKDNEGLRQNLNKITEYSKAWNYSNLNQVRIRKKDIMARLEVMHKCMQRINNMGA